MNDATAQSAIRLGHLTEQEQSQIWIEAEERQRRLHEERLKASEEKGEIRGRREGKLEGERQGQRQGKLEGKLEGKREGVLDTARLLLARSLSTEELEAEMAKLSKLKTVDGIQRALVRLLAR